MHNSIFYDNSYKSIILTTKPSADKELKASCSIPPHASNTTALSNRGETTAERVQGEEVQDLQAPDSFADAKGGEDKEAKRDGQESSEALVSRAPRETPYKNRNIVQQLDWLQSDDDSTISNTSVSSVYTDVDTVLNLFSNVQVSADTASKNETSNVQGTESVAGPSSAVMKTSATNCYLMPTTPVVDRTRSREGSDFTPPNCKDPRLRSPSSRGSNDGDAKPISAQYSLVKVFIEGEPYWKEVPVKSAPPSPERRRSPTGNSRAHCRGWSQGSHHQRPPAALHRIGSEAARRQAEETSQVAPMERPDAAASPMSPQSIQGPTVEPVRLGRNARDLDQMHLNILEELSGMPIE